MSNLEPTPEQVRAAWVAAYALANDASWTKKDKAALYQAAQAWAAVAQAGALILANRYAP